MSPELRNPEEIREDIDQTRDDLGDTVEALAGKADVKGQAKAKVDTAKADARAKADEFTSKAKDAAPESVSAGAQQAGALARENPVPIGIVAAFILGVLLGWIVRR